MPIKNAFYAQSGGVTAVINTSACAVIETARQYPEINKVLVGKNGIIGALHEQLIDTSLEHPNDISALMHTPGGAFGSCRYKLKDKKEEFERLFDVFKAHNIHYFFYNGGGDSQDTTHKIATMSQTLNYPLTCIGIPKTIDNDLPFTDNCPGFGSVAKYIAISTLEAGLDVASMAATSTKVFVLEVMGRHAGWIAAASALAQEKPNDPPHIILFPEIPFEPKKFLKKVKETVDTVGYCVIVVSEGLRNQEGKFLTDIKTNDAFGHAQLGGIAPYIAELVKKDLGYKYHWAVADYLQRSARHIASLVDVEQAYALGKAAVEFAMKGYNAVMPIIKREQDSPYRWSIDKVLLSDVANQEKKMPRDYISEDGMGITSACKTYLSALIEGEAYPPYKRGIPSYIRLQNKLIKPVLPPYSF